MTYAELIILANTIKNEIIPNANSALRIGSMFKEHIDYTEAHKTSLSTFLTKFNSMFELDVNDKIKAKKDFYSLGGVSAYGAGSSGGGGGTGDMMKAVYDTNDNGKVDLAENAEKVGGKTVSEILALVGPTDISGKVDKVVGYSLISNLEISRLSTVTNQTLAGLGGVSATDLSNALLLKQDKLTAGTNITISGSTISASGGSYVAGDFDIKNLADSTALRSYWSAKQTALTESTNLTIKDILLKDISTANESVSTFINKFNSMFELDSSGNIKALSNLYSVGGITAHSAGSGVSGLKLMGDMDANEKNINNVNTLTAKLITIGAMHISATPTVVGIFDDFNGMPIIQFDSVTDKYTIGDNAATIDNSGIHTNNFDTTNFSIIQVGTDLVFKYNGTNKSKISSDGTYTKL